MHRIRCIYRLVDRVFGMQTLDKNVIFCYCLFDDPFLRKGSSRRARILCVLCRSDRYDCLVCVICFYTIVMLGGISNCV